MELQINWSWIKNSIALLVIACIAFALQSVLTQTQNYWLLWTALLSALMLDDERPIANTAVLLVTGVVASLAIFISGLLAGYSTVILALFLTSFTFCCMALIAIFPTYDFLFILIIFFALLASFAPVTGDAHIQRLLFAGTGFALTALVQLLFFPLSISNRQHDRVAALQRLIDLTKQIFSCFTPSYPEHIYLLENRLRLRKIDFVNALIQLQTTLKNQSKRNDSLQQKEKAIVLFKKLNDVYNNLLCISELRRRVSDYAVFTLCQAELNAIKEEIITTLKAVINASANTPQPITLTTLKEKIAALEDDYHHVIQVTAPEPLVFLLCINDLKLLTEELSGLFNYV